MWRWGFARRRTAPAAVGVAALRAQGGTNNRKPDLRDPPRGPGASYRSHGFRCNDLGRRRRIDRHVHLLGRDGVIQTGHDDVYRNRTNDPYGQAAGGTR